MNWDWPDLMPIALALVALFGMFLLINSAISGAPAEWWRRRRARRRARVLLAPEPDLTGCIQRASLRLIQNRKS